MDIAYFYAIEFLFVSEFQPNKHIPSVVAIDIFGGNFLSFDIYA
jgi:hypothetical protein